MIVWFDLKRWVLTLTLEIMMFCSLAFRGASSEVPCVPVWDKKSPLKDSQAGEETAGPGSWWGNILHNGPAVN